MYHTMGVTFGVVDSSVVGKRVTDIKKIKHLSVFVLVFIFQYIVDD